MKIHKSYICNLLHVCFRRGIWRHGVELDIPGLHSCFVFTSFPLSVQWDGPTPLKQVPLHRVYFKGPSHKTMCHRIRTPAFTSTSSLSRKAWFRLLCRIFLTVWAPYEAPVQVQNRSSQSWELLFNRAQCSVTDWGLSPWENHWGGERMSPCSQIFRAEHKFPSFIPQQINVCLAKVAVYTGVRLAILYFIRVHETQMCLWAHWPWTVWKHRSHVSMGKKKGKKVSVDWDGFQPLAHNRLRKELDAEA